MVLVVQLGGASVPAIPTRVTVEPGFDADLDSEWRQLRGGFSGVEAHADPALADRWPSGSVVARAATELVPGESADLDFTRRIRDRAQRVSA